MKGLSLPINVLVIVVVAIIVLLGVVAIYFGGFSPFSSAISVEGVKNGVCEEIVRTGCTKDPATINLPEFDADQDGLTGTTDVGNDVTGNCGSSTPGELDDNFENLCRCFYNRNTKSDCRQLCGCPS